MALTAGSPVKEYTESMEKEATQMADENTTQNEQTTEQQQAAKYVWQPEDIVITSPETQEVEMAQDDSESKKAIHHATRRGADMSLAKREIRQESHAAVLAGRISLAEARELGRENGPDGPVGGKAAKTKKAPKPKTGTCIACQGETKGGRFHPGCDAKMYRIAREALAGERELTDAQREYLESSGKMAQVVAKREKDEAKRQETIAAKAEAQRAKEGAAEAAKRNSAE